MTLRQWSLRKLLNFERKSKGDVVVRLCCLENRRLWVQDLSLALFLEILAVKVDLSGPLETEGLALVKAPKASLQGSKLTKASLGDFGRFLSPRFQLSKKSLERRSPKKSRPEKVSGEGPPTKARSEKVSRRRLVGEGPPT